MAKVKVLSLPKSFTVKRSKWLRGRDGERSKLRNKNGKMCCLGFLAKASGCTNSDILDQTTPVELLINKKIRLERLVTDDCHNTIDTYTFIDINDAAGTTLEKREKALKESFKTFGIKAKFVD